MNEETIAAADLEAAFAEYRKACYGDSELHPMQKNEVRQAFFSGIHWLNGQMYKYDADALVGVLWSLLRPE